jgi:hypothetical protein
MSKLHENTVCLDVTFHRPGTRRAFRPGEVDVVKRKLGDDKDDDGKKADQSMVTASRHIFRSENYKRTVRIESDTRNWIEAHALPSSFARGTYLVPLAMLDDIYAYLEVAKDRFSDAADDLAAEYDELIEQAEKRLGELFDADKYLPKDELRQRFTCTFRLLEFGLPGEGKLTEFCKDKEMKKWLKEMESAESECKAALRTGLLELTQHLADILTPKEDGKKRNFHEATLTKVTDFLEVFSKRNVLNDNEMNKLVDKAKGVLHGKTHEAIKGDDALRTTVQDEMKKIATQLEALVESGPIREISFED